MAPVLSQHNIFGPIKNSRKFFLINPLSKNADILDPETAQAYAQGKWTDQDEMLEKGYLVDPDQEQSRFREAYLDFLDNRDQDEIQIFYVPTYACNFACSYCYQEGYSQDATQNSEEIIQAFFAYIDREFADRRKYITVFGGEPLLPGKKQQETVSLLMQKTKERNLGLAFVTNGYTLEEYVPLLSQGIIREIQVTLDGAGEMHDRRRMLKGGGATFERIAAGIDAALQAGLNVNLRTVVDKENLPGLLDLAHFAIQRGWTRNRLFKTQMGRNYELHVCQVDQNRLYDRVSLYEDLYELITHHPEFLEYHQPAYSLSKFLFEKGELPDPLFDSCPGCKTEWAFDYTGRIYSCTATVGKSGEVLGTFYPEVSRKDDIIAEWESRDVTSIPQCRECPVRLACGGGCASVAKNRTGKILSPDCRPVTELMGLGLPLYFKIK